MRSALLALAAATALAALLAGALLVAPRAAEACAFDPAHPDAYEADANRTKYNAAIDAASVNRLLPGDAFFALPPTERGTRAQRTEGAPYIPATLMKSIAWVESNMTMAGRSVPFDAIGAALISFDCGHGIMQVTTGMTGPLGASGKPSERQASIATHFAYNIARGAQLLSEKWNAAPEVRPIVGTDTGSDPTLIENWYYATWAYNGFTGPGSSQSNHPLDPSLGTWPRPAWLCDGAQSRTRYPYQELVWGCMARPATRNAQPLWAAVPATLPDFTQPAFFNAMKVSNWTYPYSSMDMPTPTPSHTGPAVTITADAARALLGAPVFSTSAQRVSISTGENGTPQATVRIHNAGTGVLTWTATSSDRFLVLSPPAGVAVGGDLPCVSAACPDSILTITINPTLLTSAVTSGRVRLSSPNGGGAGVDITVDINATFAIGAPGTSRAP